MRSRFVPCVVLIVSAIAASGCGEDAGNGDTGIGQAPAAPSGMPTSAAPQAASEGLASSMTGGEGTTADAAAGAGATPGGAGSDPVGYGVGTCEVTVTGDLERAFTAAVDRIAPDPVLRDDLFRTRYWMTDAEVEALVQSSLASTRDIYASMGDATPDPSWDPTAAAGAQAAMAAAMEALMANADEGLAGMVAPIFSLSCSGSDEEGLFTVTFQNVSADATQIPFAAGQYPISPADGFGAVVPGDAPFTPVIFAAEKSADGVRHASTWQVSQPGRFEVTHFDAERVAGTFTFDAAEATGSDGATPTAGTSRRIHVEGRFEFRCAGGSGCGQP